MASPSAPSLCLFSPPGPPFSPLRDRHDTRPHAEQLLRSLCVRPLYALASAAGEAAMGSEDVLVEIHPRELRFLGTCPSSRSLTSPPPLQPNGGLEFSDSVATMHP